MAKKEQTKIFIEGPDKSPLFTVYCVDDQGKKIVSTRGGIDTTKPLLRIGLRKLRLLLKHSEELRMFIDENTK